MNYGRRFSDRLRKDGLGLFRYNREKDEKRAKKCWRVYRDDRVRIEIQVE